MKLVLYKSEGARILLVLCISQDPVQCLAGSRCACWESINSRAITRLVRRQLKPRG
jgi:hypothetical protein